MRTTPQQKIEDFTRRGWWGERSLVTLFDDAVRSNPGDLALVDQFNRSEFSDGEPLRLTFGELSNIVDSIATGLYQHGIRQEHIVVVQLPNIAELPAVYLALARLGAIVAHRRRIRCLLRNSVRLPLRSESYVSHPKCTRELS